MLEDSLNHSDDDSAHETGQVALLRLPAVPGKRPPAVCADGSVCVCVCLSPPGFKVVVRVRPPLPRELNGDKRFQNIARIENDRSITLSENLPALDDPRSDEATAVCALLVAMAVSMHKIAPRAE
jgi:hypothetical protein